MLINASEPIALFNGDYIKAIGRLLNETPTRTVANFLIGCTVQYSAHYLNEQIRAIESKHLKTKPRERSDECVDITSESLAVLFNAMYARKYLGRTDKTIIEDLVRRIRQQFQIVMEHSNWMDAATKANAIRKLNAMGAGIAYPEFFMNDTALEKYYAGMEIDEHNYFESMLQINVNSVRRLFGNLRQPFDYWHIINEEVTMVNAFYAQRFNTIRKLIDFETS